MKAEILEIVGQSQTENAKADEAFLTLQIAILGRASRALVRRASALGINLSADKANPPSLKEAQRSFLVLRGHFLTALRTLEPCLDGISIHELAMSHTLLVKSLDLDFRSMPEKASITVNESMTPKEYQDAAGRRIAELRKDQEFSQEKLAKAIGTTSATIARIENGKQRISITKVYLIAEALGISPYQILVGPLPVSTRLTMVQIADIRKQLDHHEAQIKAEAKTKG